MVGGIVGIGNRGKIEKCVYAGNTVVADKYSLYSWSSSDVRALSSMDSSGIISVVRFRF